MSKHETPMTLAYWESVGGTLIEEARIVERAVGQGCRDVDAIIVPDGPHQRVRAARRVPDLAGKNIVVVQTKAKRLGMYLLGQAMFSKLIIERRFRPASVRSIALCTASDAVLEPLAEEHGVEVVVLDVRRRSILRRS